MFSSDKEVIPEKTYVYSYSRLLITNTHAYYERSF